VSKSSRGLGCWNGLLTSIQTVFLVLKLADVIDWSWVWVLAPIWMSMLFALAALVIIALVYPDVMREFWAALQKWWAKRKKERNE